MELGLNMLQVTEKKSQWEKEWAAILLAGVLLVGILPKLTHQLHHLVVTLIDKTEFDPVLSDKVGQQSESVLSYLNTVSTE